MHAALRLHSIDDMTYQKFINKGLRKKVGAGVRSTCPYGTTCYSITQRVLALLVLLPFLQSYARERFLPRSSGSPAPNLHPGIRRPTLDLKAGLPPVAGSHVAMDGLRTLRRSPGLPEPPGPRG